MGVNDREPTFNEAMENLRTNFRLLGRALYDGLPAPVKRLLHWADAPIKIYILVAILTGLLALDVTLSIVMR